MFDLLLRRARLADDTLTDIAIQDGKIAATGDINAPARKTVELNGDVFVSAGWIDSHVHCYPNSPIYHDEPDSVGIATGVTTVVDAGSTGADDVDDFYTITRKASTEVFALLNISRVGLIAQNELANMANIDADAVKQAVTRHPDFIVGLKARMSSSVVGENGITAGARESDPERERRPAADGAHWQQPAEPRRNRRAAELRRHHHPLLQRQAKPHPDALRRAACLHYLRPEARRASGRWPRYGELQL